MVRRIYGFKTAPGRGKPGRIAYSVVVSREKGEQEDEMGEMCHVKKTLSLLVNARDRLLRDEPPPCIDVH